MSSRRSLKISCVVEYEHFTEIPFPRHRNVRKKDKLSVLNIPLAELIVISPHQREFEFQEPGNFCLWNPESGKFCSWNPDSCFYFGIQNTLQRIRNPTNDWNSESKFHCLRIWNPVPGFRIHGVESRKQDCLGFSFLERVINWSKYRPFLSACGGLITALDETVMSPNYPSDYPNSATCVWAINPGQAFQLEFEKFHTESGYDLLKGYSSLTSFTGKCYYNHMA